MSFLTDISLRGTVDMRLATNVRYKAASIGNDAMAADAELERSKLALETKAFRIPLSSFVIHDDIATKLPGTSSSGDLAFNGTTHGTNIAKLRTADLKAAGATTLKARCFFPVPMEYVEGEAALIRLAAGMETTVADVSATVDVGCFAPTRLGVIGSELVTDAAQSINSLTAADFDFDLDVATLLPGDLLDILVTVAVNDAATGTAVFACINAAELVLSVRG